MNLIKTLPALKQAILNTYLYDSVLAVVMVLVMLLVAVMIKFQPGRNDRSGSKRRTAFFILLALTLVGTLAFDYVVFLKKVAVPAFMGKYRTNMVVASIVATAVYFLVGFVIIKLAPIGSKLNSIFPKKEN
jgi:hypothetical protein